MTKGRNFILLFAVLLVSFFSMNQNALAQQGCPPDGAIPPNIPWIDGGGTIVSITVNGITCDYKVGYCWRNIGDVEPMIEVYVWDVSPIDINCFNQIQPPPSGPELLKLAAYALIKQNPDNNQWPCPPCPTTEPNYRFYYDNCWYNGSPCAGGNSYCRTELEVCCDGNGNRITNTLNSFVIGDDCVSPCEPQCN